MIYSLSYINLGFTKNRGKQGIKQTKNSIKSNKIEKNKKIINCNKKALLKRTITKNTLNTLKNKVEIRRGNRYKL